MEQWGALLLVSWSFCGLAGGSFRAKWLDRAAWRSSAATGCSCGDRAASGTISTKSRSLLPPPQGDLLHGSCNTPGFGARAAWWSWDVLVSMKLTLQLFLDLQSIQRFTGCTTPCAQGFGASQSCSPASVSP